MDKTIKLLKDYSNEESLKIVALYSTEKIDYGDEWEDDLFYKGIQFASKHGTNFHVITFVYDKLYNDKTKPIDLENTTDYIFTQKNLNKMNLIQ